MTEAAQLVENLLNNEPSLPNPKELAIRVADQEEKQNLAVPFNGTAHRQNIMSGLGLKWYRTGGSSDRTDDAWHVAAYSDESRWLFTNGGAEQLQLLGEISDGLGKSEVLSTDSGAIIALYAGEPQAYGSGEEWLESMPEVDRNEAAALLQR